MTALTPALLTSLVFGAALLLNVLVKLWLASRQIRAVARHRGAVPAEFARAVQHVRQVRRSVFARRRADGDEDHRRVRPLGIPR